MKKFTAFLAALAIGSAAASAAVVDPGVLTDAKYELTPKAMEFMKNTTKRAQMGVLNDDEQMMTRSWIDAKAGMQYDFSVLLSSQKICELVSFEGGIQYPFSRIPYYAANFILQGRKYNVDKGEVSDQVATYITWMACWPSYYIYEQIFTYDGPLDSSNMIPEDLRDYEAVSMTQLANDPTFTRRFQEVPVIGSDPEPGTKKFPFFTLLENAMSSDGGQCVVNDDVCQTSITTTGSADNPNYISTTFDFQAFDNTNSDIDTKMTIYYKKSTGTNGILRLAYVGGARVEGFEPITTTLLPFGDLHLFNAGEWSSEAFGDTNPFTGSWGPYTALYLATGDTAITWDIDTTAKEFSTDIIGDMLVNVSASEFDEHASSIMGYLFADPKYARDINLNPGGEFFNVQYPIEFDEGDRNVSIYIVPEKNTFVPAGYNYDTWCEEYGLLPIAHNFPEMPIQGSTLAWGTTDGFRATILNSFKNTIEIQSTGDVIYHYDPTDMSKIRTYSSVGELSYDSAVEGVMVGTAIITAGNGQLNVKPGVAAPVAIYTLDGICVLRADVAEGETVSVPASKGIYVVTVDGKATKFAF